MSKKKKNVKLVVPEDFKISGKKALMELFRLNEPRFEGIAAKIDGNWFRDKDGYIRVCDNVGPMKLAIRQHLIGKPHIFARLLMWHKIEEKRADITIAAERLWEEYEETFAGTGQAVPPKGTPEYLEEKASYIGWEVLAAEEDYGSKFLLKALAEANPDNEEIADCLKTLDLDEVRNDYEAASYISQEPIILDFILQLLEPYIKFYKMVPGLQPQEVQRGS